VQFQKKQFPAWQPDGIVDRGYWTIQRLNRLAYPQVDYILLGRGRAAVAFVKGYVLNTLRHLHLAEQYNPDGPPTLFNYAAEARLLDAHFHLQRPSDRLRDIGEIRKVYNHMLTLTGHVPAGPDQRPAFGFLDFSGAEGLMLVDKGSPTNGRRFAKAP
jgi:hypothetical protein